MNSNFTTIRNWIRQSVHFYTDCLSTASSFVTNYCTSSSEKTIIEGNLFNKMSENESYLTQ